MKRNRREMVTSAVEELGMNREIFAIMSVSFRASLFWTVWKEGGGAVRGVTSSGVSVRKAWEE